MQDVCRMNIFQTTQDLIDERLKMCISKWLARSNDGSKITLHELYGVLVCYTREVGTMLPSYR